MNQVDIWFVHLGIQITNHSKGITIGNFTIAYYGVMIALAVLAGIGIASWVAKRSGQQPEIYSDLALYAVVMGIIGARIYYVIFDWDNYKNDLLEVFNLRAGGLAIYGGVIAAVATVFVFSRVKKIPFGRLLDTAGCGLVLGQIIGRWGNFFNCEAFGGYTDNLFAMRLNTDLVHGYMISQELLDKAITVDGVSYIQVHPTFLYEGTWNFFLLLFMLWFWKRKKWEGEVFCCYMIGYGLGRLWIEGLRTDQLKLFGTGLAVSQVVSILMILGGLGLILYHRRKNMNTAPEPAGE